MAGESLSVCCSLPVDAQIATENVVNSLIALTASACVNVISAECTQLNANAPEFLPEFSDIDGFWYDCATESKTVVDQSSLPDDYASA